jgi:hypothetical protein
MLLVLAGLSFGAPPDPEPTAEVAPTEEGTEAARPSIAAEEKLKENTAVPPQIRYAIGESTRAEDQITSAPMGRWLPLSATTDGTVLSGVSLAYPVDRCPSGPRFEKHTDLCVHQLDYTPMTEGGGRFSLGTPLSSFFGDRSGAGRLTELGVDPKKTWQELNSYLCVYSSPPSSAGMPAPHCPTREGMQVEEHALKVTDGGRKAMLSLGLSAILVVLGNLLIQRKQLRGLDPLLMFSRMFLSSAYYTTAANTLNLARLQVVLWTKVVLFGFLYVWNTSEAQLALTSDVLVLMGIGAGTALGARSASSGGGEERYYLLVRDRKPQLRDLVTVGGRADVFKLQMLLFTLVSMWMVVQELLYIGTFPTLSSELLGLMGISSATYLGNEAIGGSQGEVMAAWKKLEEACAAANISIDSNHELRELGMREQFDGEAELRVKEARNNLQKLLVG